MKSLSENLVKSADVDLIAQQISAEIRHLVVMKYPQMTEIEGWESYKRAVSKVVRDSLQSLTDAAQSGTLGREAKKMTSKRARELSHARSVAGFNEIAKSWNKAAHTTDDNQ